MGRPNGETGRLPFRPLRPVYQEGVYGGSEPMRQTHSRVHRVALVAHAPKAILMYSFNRRLSAELLDQQIHHEIDAEFGPVGARWFQENLVFEGPATWCNPSEAVKS